MFAVHDLQGIKWALRRAVDIFSDPDTYARLRENASKSVIDTKDVCHAYNAEFHRLRSKLFASDSDIQVAVPELEEIRRKIAGLKVEDGPQAIEVSEPRGFRDTEPLKSPRFPPQPNPFG